MKSKLLKIWLVILLISSPISFAILAVYGEDIGAKIKFQASEIPSPKFQPRLVLPKLLNTNEIPTNFASATGIDTFSKATLTYNEKNEPIVHVYIWNRGNHKMCTRLKNTSLAVSIRALGSKHPIRVFPRLDNPNDMTRKTNICIPATTPQAMHIEYNVYDYFARSEYTGYSVVFYFSLSLFKNIVNTTNGCDSILNQKNYNNGCTEDVSFRMKIDLKDS